MAITRLRVSEAAALLGVSDDTVRRWGDAGRLDLTPGPNGRLTVDGAQLAALAQELASVPEAGGGRVSARNRLTGIVTRVTKDLVMAQVDLQAGPFRLVSLVSREAVDELGIEVGSVVTATVKATSVGLALP